MSSARLQNEELFAFTDFQKERIAKTMQVGDKKDVAIAELKKEVPVWEGEHGRLSDLSRCTHTDGAVLQAGTAQADSAHQTSTGTIKMGL